jgi:hypothetical protein
MWAGVSPIGPGADVGRGEPSLGADVGGGEPVPGAFVGSEGGAHSIPHGAGGVGLAHLVPSDEGASPFSLRADVGGASPFIPRADAAWVSPLSPGALGGGVNRFSPGADVGRG